MSQNRHERQFLDKLARQIARARKQQGFSQEKMAEESGLDRVAIANIETGRRRPTVTTLYRLSRALNIDITKFFK